MVTVLLYVIVVALIAGLLFLVAAFVFGRSEELAPIPAGMTATKLPRADVTGADVRALRFQQVVRGYKADEVDWALDHLAGEIDQLRSELARVEAHAESLAAQVAESRQDPQ